LYNAIVKEADAVSVAGLDESDPTKETNVYPIIEVKVATGVVNVTYPVNGINFYGFEFISEGGGGDTPADPTAPTTWDFTQALSDNDAANLAADKTTWTFDESNNYWKNVAVLADQNVFTDLTAGNAVLDVTKGLTFARDNSEGLAADKVRIKSKNYVAVNGGKISISLGTLVKDDVVKIRFKGAGVSERSLTVSNTEVVSGSLATEDQDEHEVELKVLKNNVVTITTSNGFQFMAITVNAELPTGVNGVKAEGAKAKVGGTVNLDGQQVGADYKGVVIKDGKKVMQ
jgi:predicted RNA-binding protein